MFFGGTTTETKRELVGKYKNGKDKFQAKTYKVEVKGFGLDPTVVGAAVGASGYYSVDEKVLKSIVEYPFGTKTTLGQDIAASILKHRTLDKELNTYLEPIKALIFPDGCIHGNINTTATVTGRYSSSNPNLQNITDYSNIKSMFTSKWGDDGVIVEADFNQLEIVGLAYLSQDKQLITDINMGVDIHSALYEQAFGHVPTKSERKHFKRVSFALIYGAGVKTISDDTGIPRGKVISFIEAFKERYPGVVRWWDNMWLKVQDNRVHSGLSDEKGRPYGCSVIKQVTGRCLYFREYYNEYSKGCTFSPSQVKNYPVQSFATGDIVPMVLGKVYRAMLDEELLEGKAVIVNTVHDSIVFDCQKSVLPTLVGLLMKVMPDVGNHLKEEFGINDFNVDVGVSIRAGKSWKEDSSTDSTFKAVVKAAGNKGS